MTNDATVTRDDLPSLYHTATLASQNAQNTLLLFTKLNLGFLVAGAFLSSVNVGLIDNPNTVSTITYSSTILLTLGIFITIAIEMSGYERKWYDGRAIAESIKTLAWRFMMNSEPYRSETEPDKRFCEDLADILKDKKSFGDVLGGNIATQDEITEKMRAIKKLRFSERKSIYLKNRIKSQRSWYSLKSSHNKRFATYFFWGLMISQAIAVLTSVWVQMNPEAIVNPTGVITTIVAGLFAWTQLKQFKTLAESYGLTTHELGIVESKFHEIKNNEDLSSFVLEAETAISREHTVWLARRVNV